MSLPFSNQFTAQYLSTKGMDENALANRHAPMEYQHRSAVLPMPQLNNQRKYYSQDRGK